MYTIKIDSSENIYDKIFSYLNQFSRSDIKIYSKEPKIKKRKDTLVEFFTTSPLSDIDFERDK